MDHPPALNAGEWLDVRLGWTSPCIVVSDRAGLIEILRLCGPERFGEAYAFLAPNQQEQELTAMLGPHTQLFAYDEEDRLRQVWGRADYLWQAQRQRRHILLIIEQPSTFLHRALFFQEMVCNVRTNGITLIVIERSIHITPPVILENADASVAHPVLTERESRKTYRDFFSRSYDQLASFTAAHAHETAQGARIVWKNAGQHDDIAHSVRSLVGADRGPFTLQPHHQMRTLNDMSDDERREHMAFVGLNKDVALTAAQTVELFCASGRDLHCFATSRHMPAIQTYLAWIADVRAELLAITDTSCGHMPRVLCDLIVEYL